MKRHLERNLLRLGGTWNLINGLITVLGFSSQLKIDGISYLTNSSIDGLEVSGSLIDSVYMIAVGYGLIQIIIGIVNYIVVRNMKNNQIQKGFIIWLGAIMSVSIVTADIMGTLLYVVLFVLYQSRNKAIRLSKQYHTQTS